MQGVSLARTRVWHQRTQVANNAFSYSALYCYYRLGETGQPWGNWLFGYNRPAMLALLDRDLGSRQTGLNWQWIQRQLALAGIELEAATVRVLTMPRLLGFAFNPVSFWFCSDQAGQLRGVVAEVHNTFRDRHLYLCAHEDGRPISSTDELFARKEFHVSPFFGRDGQYRFRFDLSLDGVRVDIDYLDGSGQLLLNTGLHSQLLPFSHPALLRELLRSPLVSLASSAQIGWQAIKLRMKKVPWHDRPQPQQPAYTRTLDSSLTQPGDT